MTHFSDWRRGLKMTQFSDWLCGLKMTHFSDWLCGPALLPTVSPTSAFVTTSTLQYRLLRRIKHNLTRRSFLSTIVRFHVART
jgi:hypothetical protein